MTYFGQVANSQSIQGIGTGVKMTLGQLQVNKCVLQTGMSQQQLDGAQIGPGINEVRAKGMPERMRPNLFLDTGPFCRSSTDFKDSLS
jgi:hypothetical protein